jgi:hypothetical protein
MKQERKEELEAYYRDAGSWAGDRRADETRSRRLAWESPAAPRSSPSPKRWRWSCCCR